MLFALQITLILNGLFDIASAFDIINMDWFKFHSSLHDEEELRSKDALAAWIMTYGAVRLIAGLEYPSRPLLLLATITYAIESLYYQKRGKLAIAMLSVIFMQFTLYG